MSGTIFQIDLNEESALVLLRCLCWSPSAAQNDALLGELLYANVSMLSKQIASKLADVRLKELSVNYRRSPAEKLC